MHTIQVDDLEVSGIALKTALHLKDMDTRLTTVLIDISGSISGHGIIGTIWNTLFGISDALGISAAPDSLVSLVQFDDAIRHAHTVPVKMLGEFLRGYEIHARGTSSFIPVADCVNGRCESPIDFTRRIDTFSKTPVMFISDGCMPETSKGYFMDSMFGTEDTFFMKYGEV